MKKAVKIMALTLAFVMAVTGCGKKPLEEDKALATATNHGRMMASGNFEAVVADFDAVMAKRLDAAAMETAYQQVAALAGDYTGIYSNSYQANKGRAVVYHRMQHENLTICLTFAYNSDGQISGLWLSTDGQKVELTETEAFAEGLITVGDFEVEGVATLPKNTENYPVAVLVQGSGASDYDETIGANKPFREIAHALAEKGIASVRINKRFYQYPEQAGENITIYDEYMDDIYAAVAYAKENISSDVYIIGHSQGGMSAPKIAADTGAKGVIMMAGTIRGLEDVVYRQNMAAIDKMDNLSEDEKQAMRIQIGDEVAKVKELKEGDTTAPLGIPARYWLSIRELKTREYLENTHIPVLVMQGTADFQVSYEYDYQKMERLFGEKDNFTFKAYEGLNHLFMPQTKPGVTDVSEYEEANHIPAYVLNDIADFIVKQ